MAGMLDLDALLMGQGTPNPGTFQLEEAKRPVEIDYSQGIPMPYLGKKKTAEEQMDEELKAFQARNPVPPQQMPAQGPIPGLLGPDIAGTMPQLAGGAAPPLPPPVNVAPPPQVASVPATPPAMAPAGPSSTDISAAARQPASAPPGRTESLWDKIGSGINNNSALLLALGAGFSGAPSFGTGMSRAFSQAIPAGQLDTANKLKASQIQSTYSALLKAGVPPHLALAATQNPEILKKVTEDYLADTKWETKTVKDGLGNEKLVAFNPKTQEVKDLSAATRAAGGGTAPGEVPQNYDPQTNRDEAFLKTLDPIEAAAVKDIANGKMPATGRNLQKMLPYVARYENGFDNTTYQARQALQKSYYGGGEGAKALRSANTTIDHGIQLKKAIDDLHNYTIVPQLTNTVTGFVQKQLDPKYQAALKEFKTNAELYSKELDFALTGKSTVSGQNHIREMFDPNASPEENQASLRRTLEMLDQRIGEHENTYKSGMNQKGAVFNDMLSKRDELNKIIHPAGSEPSSTSIRKSKLGIPWSVVQ